MTGTITRRDVLAGLLAEIAGEPVLDDDKYSEFVQVLRMGASDPLLAFAAEELNAYYVLWRSSRNLLAQKADMRPHPSEVDLYRANLELLARAVRAGIEDFDTYEELRQRLRDL